MKSLIARSFWVFSLGLLMACSGTPPQQVACGSVDWFEVGRRDGSVGRLPAAFDGHAQSCSGEVSQQARVQYRNGRNNGLLKFCSAENGWRLGESGQAAKEYREVCPRSFEGSFLQNYQRGRKAYLLQNERAGLLEQLRLQSLSYQQKNALNRRIAQVDSELEGLKDSL